MKLGHWLFLVIIALVGYYIGAHRPAMIPLLGVSGAQ